MVEVRQRPLRLAATELRVVRAGTTRRTVRMVRRALREIMAAVAKGAVAGMVFRGEFDPTKTDYVVQNVVFIRAGSNAGAFICVKDAPDATHPPTNPDTGNEFWMAWPGSFPLGQWM